MPRLPTSLVLQAYRENPLLPILLKECRTLQYARNELRWLRESAIARCGLQKRPFTLNRGHDSSIWRRKLKQMCAHRGKGKPLQYILGNQPFGDLEILCEKGVLIPRTETELYTFHTKDLVLKGLRVGEFERNCIHVLDICSGSGCISLLLHSLLAPHVEHLTIIGVDISPQAINLAVRNKKHNLSRGILTSRAGRDVIFEQFDILDNQKGHIPPLVDNLKNILATRRSANTDSDSCRSTWDVLISNPPYISPSNMIDGTTSRSVRKYEPIQALVPPPGNPLACEWSGLGAICQEDTFYPHLLLLALKLDVKLVVLECGDAAQAQRVVKMARAIFIISETAERRVSVDIYNESEMANDYDGGARAVVVKTF
ncbi:putative RNA methyltransferase [Talaromyces proteolyticus]|uniref:RNA methyltransferase n=1 Tax=Talaromyces proteolyticus TaxID=1131652 RepID=A0AAD4PUS8_9EURO|nr:putative RNA methyltransferase [Talaromyces proteolyticus]KAH8689717.1 putative RNA methyltransferase [Talaromyces proteolyticus]